MSTILIALTGNPEAMAARAEKLHELTQKYNPQKIIFTGKHSKLNSRKGERASQAAEFFNHMKKTYGWKKQHVQLEEKSQDTRDHFIYLPELLKSELSNPTTQFVIITNWWHMPRVRIAAWLYWKEARGRLKFAPAKTGVNWMFVAFNRSWWEPLSTGLIVWKYLFAPHTPHAV